MAEKILEVKNLKTYFRTDAGLTKAVNDVSFSVERGKTLGIVGESGCGKSITSLSIMGLVETPPGVIAGGEIILDGQDLLKKTDDEMRAIRGKKIAMIFQEPMTSLNPVFTIGQQLVEALMLHEKITKQQAKEKAVEMLKLVRIPLAEKRFNEYPHQLSGGMRQRVMIAMALCCDPELLICDEPTTALDVTIQAQILELMMELKEKLGMAIIMITHDLGVVASMCDRIAVMYAGKVVEYGTTEDIFYNPSHEYTKGLLRSIPKLNEKEHSRLVPIEGSPVDMLNPPAGCPFAPRCDSCMKICLRQMPEYTDISDVHYSACWLLQKAEFEKAQGGKI